MVNKRKKRILAISYLFPNSQQPNHGIFVLNRLKAMSEYADITVINPIPDSFLYRSVDRFNYLRAIPEQEKIHGVDVYHPRYFSIPGHFKSIEVYTYRKAVHRLLTELNIAEFDLIDLHWTYPDLPCGYWLSKKLNIPFHVTLRGMEAFHLQDNGLRKHLVKHYLGKADHIVSLSQEMARKADELAGTIDKTTVIRNGVDTNKFHYIEQSQARNELGLNSSDKIILGVGALIYRKGFDLVIKGLAQVKDAVQGPVKFYILGAEGPEGDYRKELKALIKQYQLEDNIVFAGAVPNAQLVTWYNAADIFCLSSRGEGSPNVLTEALACGTPAVATDVGSVPEIMASENNLGYCVESENITQITEALTKLLSGEVDRKENARVFHKYNWHWCAKEVAKVIDDE